MNRQRIMLLAVLVIFILGMVLAPVNASHKVKVGKYKGKLSNKQYKKLKTAYKKDKQFSSVSVKSTNKKYHRITVQYMNGYSPHHDKNYKRGFYGSVWDTRYGIDGTKIINKKIRI